MLNVPTLQAKFRELGCAQLFDGGLGLCWKLELPLPFDGNGAAFCGPVLPVTTVNDMLPCLVGLRDLQQGWVLLVQNTAEPSLALFGDIFARAAELQGAAGVVLDGAVRDTSYLRGVRLPVRASRICFMPAKAAPPALRETAAPVFAATRRTPCGQLRQETVAVERGDWLFVDDDGVLLVRAVDVRVVIRSAQLLDARERRLRDAISTDRPLAELIGLEGFLSGEGALRSRV